MIVHTWEFCLDYVNVMHVVISQLVQYLRICCNYQNFAYRSKLLTTRLLRQGYVYQKLCTTFVHRYPKTLQKYGRCLKNIVTECSALPWEIWLFDCSCILYKYKYMTPSDSAIPLYRKVKPQHLTGLSLFA